MNGTISMALSLSDNHCTNIPVPESGDQLVVDDGVLPALALVQAVLLRPRLVTVEALCGVEVKLKDGVLSRNNNQI